MFQYFKTSHASFESNFGKSFWDGNDSEKLVHCLGTQSTSNSIFNAPNVDLDERPSEIRKRRPTPQREKSWLWSEAGNVTKKALDAWRHQSQSVAGQFVSKHSSYPVSNWKCKMVVWGWTRWLCEKWVQLYPLFTNDHCSPFIGFTKRVVPANGAAPPKFLEKVRYIQPIQKQIPLSKR